MIVVLDNHDSFVYNLARYMALAGWEYVVARSDEITIDEIRMYQPRGIVLSPGPCTPAEAGICVETIQKLGPEIPILGVCLGHQCIGAAYGAAIIRAEPVHGKASKISHEGDALLNGLPSPFDGGRYHSLVIEPRCQKPLIVTARTADGTVMAVRHSHYPVHGVQFHPESILTPEGSKVIENFTRIALEWDAQKAAAA